MRELKDLPNTEGFRFIGITKLGNRLPCIVARSEGIFRAMDCGTGAPIYNNLVGWEPSPPIGNANSEES